MLEMNGGTSVPTQPLHRYPDLLEDRWRLERCIGSGAFGRVYLAKDTKTRERVAIKLFHPNAKTGVLNELRLGLRNKAFVQVLAVGYTAERKYIVYEYLAGGNLREYLSSYTRLETPHALHIARETARSLKVLHDAKTIHRDLKPENVLLTRSEWPFEIRLCDFGHVGSVARHQPDQSLYGSPGYMAPEQRSESYDHRVDIYALGVLMYEMLFGKRPERNNAPMEDARLPGWNKLPPAFVEFMSKSLALDPNERYLDMTSWLSDFEAVAPTLKANYYLERHKPQTRNTVRLEERWKRKVPQRILRAMPDPSGRLLMQSTTMVLSFCEDGDLRLPHLVSGRKNELCFASEQHSEWGWLTQQGLCWQQEEDEHLVPHPDNGKRWLQGMLHPQRKSALVAHPQGAMLCSRDEVLWNLEFLSYGQSPALAFSPEGNYVWLTVEMPQTQLTCMSHDGDLISQTAIEGQEVQLLPLDEERVLSSVRGQPLLQCFSRQGQCISQLRLPSPFVAMQVFDEDKLMVQCQQHLHWLTRTTLSWLYTFPWSRSRRVLANGKGKLFVWKSKPPFTTIHSLEVLQ
ncbi:MAG: serine/threonine protein kinase [Deltaproteobacteria bacterium]|nr:MAG: serine/threonine protein kinase [Deltaproteobacteria bacterium]